MAKKIKMGMIGGGSNSFIGVLHRLAAYMSEDYDFVGGVFGSKHDESIRFAQEKEIDTSRVYADIATFVAKENALPADEKIQAVVIVTPNNLHHAQAKELLEGGFHIICDKPITITSAEAIELQQLADSKKLVFAVTHTYTGYPMVREMKAMIADGLLGTIQKVDAQYYQGWINSAMHDAVQRNSIWRLDPKRSGISSCMGDIGVHAFNMIEYTTGMQVEKVLSDISTLYDDNALDVDGSVLLRFKGNNVRGLVRASQIATGEENNLQIMIYGSKGGFVWKQEEPTFLYHFIDGEPMRVIKPGYEYNTAFAQESTRMAPGHPEGIFDAMSFIYAGAAQAIRGESFRKGAFPDIVDGVRGMRFIEATVESSKKDQEWIAL